MRPRRIRAIAAIVAVGVLAVPLPSGGQPAAERASIEGIRAGVKERSIVYFCRGLAGAFMKAADALSMFVTAPIDVKGGVGEDIVSKALGITKNTTAYEGGTRIPDFRDGNKWYEVKNVKRQGWSKQLRDTWRAASKTAGRTYTIITRHDTKLSPRLLREVYKRGGRIRILKCLPPLG